MVLSDSEIIARARAGMISPFTEGQIRTATSTPKPAGRLMHSTESKLISYGTSSYGYDARVDRHFKVFTNVHSAVVDPKAFDDNSFVSIEADEILIPPNSFALATTVEYFKIPRDLLVICLGKSTYARCFSGDTAVTLANNTTETFHQMLDAPERERFGYGVDPETGRLQITQLSQPRWIGKDTLLKITLSNGAVIHATPDHGFLDLGDTYIPAGELVVGDRLHVLDRRIGARGYEILFDPLDFGTVHMTHRLADEWNVARGIYPQYDSTWHRHHADQNKLNNYPTNIVRTPYAEHISQHNAERTQADYDYQRACIQAALDIKMLDPVFQNTWKQRTHMQAVAFWNDPQYASKRAELVLRRQQLCARPEWREAQRARIQAQWNDPGFYNTQVAARRARGWTRTAEQEAARAQAVRAAICDPNITATTVLTALRTAGTMRGAARILGVDRSVFRRFKETLTQWRAEATVGNHRVVSIRELPGQHDVFCLTSLDTGNFALAAGPFVENCGIIVNVTPLEPEWEGQVTLEFSNTTPLPAKIYAGEGACQFIFLRASEVCKTSYADRDGKYQGQRNVTLPRL